MNSTLRKRQLNEKAVGALTGCAVVLLGCIVTALWLYLRRKRTKRHVTSRENGFTSLDLPGTNRASWVDQLRGSRYWSADDIGKEGMTQISTVQTNESVTRPESRIVILPSPEPPCEPPSPESRRKGREEGVSNSTRHSIQAPPLAYDKRSARRKSGDVRVRPASRRVKTWSKHISLQILDMSKLAPEGQKVDGSKSRASWSPMHQPVVTDLDWQVYRQ